MNKVFFLLSAVLTAFALWFVFGLPIWLCAMYLITITAYIFKLPQRLIDTLSDAERDMRNRRLQREESGQIAFAPIQDYRAASLADQLTSDMTIRDIEDFVYASTHHDEKITAKATVVERKSLLSEDD